MFLETERLHGAGTVVDIRIPRVCIFRQKDINMRETIIMLGRAIDRSNPPEYAKSVDLHDLESTEADDGLTCRAGVDEYAWVLGYILSVHNDAGRRDDLHEILDIDVLVSCVNQRRALWENRFPDEHAEVLILVD